MTEQGTIKSKNIALVIIFITWCLAVYIAFQTGPSGFWDRVQTAFSELRVKDGLFLVMAPLLALVCTGLISSAVKASLVFWRIRHILPGHRAFSKWAETDPRIDTEKLHRKLGELPKDPTKQNTAWYALLKEHGKVPAVAEAHGQYLLARDLAAISLLFAVFGSIALMAVENDLKWAGIYFFAMLLHYFILAIVARNHGNALVCNVLAEHSTSP